MRQTYANLGGAGRRRGWLVERESRRWRGLSARRGDRVGLRPAAAQRLEQVERRGEARLADLGELVLRGEQRALRVERAAQVVGTFAVAQFGQLKRAPCFFEDGQLCAFLVAVAGGVAERVFHLLQRGVD